MILDNFKITWGIHKELFQLFTKDNKDYFPMFGYDPQLTEAALTIALSDRDTLGKITTKVDLENIPLEELQLCVSYIDNYFREFFFQNQTRLTQIQQAILAAQSSS